MSATKHPVQFPTLRALRKRRERALPGDLLRRVHEPCPCAAGERAADTGAADAEVGKMLHRHGRLQSEDIERLGPTGYWMQPVIA